MNHCIFSQTMRRAEICHRQEESKVTSPGLSCMCCEALHTPPLLAPGAGDDCSHFSHGMDAPFCSSSTFRS